MKIFFYVFTAFCAFIGVVIAVIYSVHINPPNKTALDKNIAENSITNLDTLKKEEVNNEKLDSVKKILQLRDQEIDRLVKLNDSITNSRKEESKKQVIASDDKPISIPKKEVKKSKSTVVDLSKYSQTIAEVSCVTAKYFIKANNGDIAVVNCSSIDNLLASVNGYPSARKCLADALFVLDKQYTEDIIFVKAYKNAIHERLLLINKNASEKYKIEEIDALMLSIDTIFSNVK